MIRAVQMDNLRGLLGIRKMDKVPIPHVQHCAVCRGEVDENIDEGVL